MHLQFLLAIPDITKASSGMLAEFYYPFSSTWASLNQIQGDTGVFPTAPFRMYTLTTSEDTGNFKASSGYFGRYTTYFMPPEEGKYKFHLTCNAMCTLRITESSCSSSTKTDVHSIYVSMMNYYSPSALKEITLNKYKYCFEIYYRGAKDIASMVGLGLTYPNGTQSIPLSSELFLIPDLYAEKKVLVNYYFSNNILIDSFIASQQYIDKSVDVTSTSQYTQSGSQRSRLYSSGFVSVASTYFKTSNGDSLFFNVETCYASCKVYVENVALDYYYGGWFQGYSYKSLSDGWKKLEIFHSSNANKNDKYELSWWMGGKSFYPETSIVPNNGYYIPSVDILNSSSTSLGIKVNGAFIRPISVFQMLKFTLYVQRVGNNFPITEINGAVTPATVVVGNLNEYTSYTVWVVYAFQGIMARNKNNWAQTSEDVPSAPPTDVRAAMINSTVIGCSWGVVPIEEQNGVITGYVISYAQSTKNATVFGNWESIDISANVMQSLIENLNYWTYYAIKIAAKTRIGTGTFSSAVIERTDESVPFLSPVKLDGFNTSETSLRLTWDHVPEYGRLGNIVKYTVQYWKDFQITPFNKTVNGSDTLEVELTHLEWFRWYNVRVAAHTVKGMGPFSDPIKVQTDEWVPEVPPSNVSGYNVSSTEILVKFENFATEEVLNGYVAYSKVEYRREDQPNSPFQVVYGAMGDVIISGLEFYLSYTIQVAIGTRKGYGPPSNQIHVMTDEGVPSEPPRYIRSTPLSSTSLKVIWSDIQSASCNGIIVQYNVTYRQANSTEEWKTVFVPNSERTVFVVLEGLEKYRHYDIMIAGMTRYGAGVFSTPGEYSSDLNLFRTGEDRPESPPLNLRVDTFEKDSINVTWNPVYPEDRRGVIIQYKIEYYDTTLSDNPPLWKEKLVGGNVHKTVINELKFFTHYAVRISAATIKGYGNYSEEVVNRTNEGVPDVYPSNFECWNTSSTSLKCAWDRVPEVFEKANGFVLGFNLFVSVVDCFKAELPSPCNSSAETMTTVKMPTMEVELLRLERYTEYTVQVEMFNSVQAGPRSPGFHIYTEEDIPSVAPLNLQVYSGKTTSILAYWDPIPFGHRHGIILGFHVYYRQIPAPPITDLLEAAKKKKETSRRRRRAVDDGSDDKPNYEVLPRHYLPAKPPSSMQFNNYPENVMTVNYTVSGVEIPDLAENQWFTIRLTAFTSINEGPSTSLNQSCKQSLATRGPNVTIADRYSLEEFELTFEELHYNYTRGTVFEYAIMYYPVEKNDQTLSSFEQIKKIIWVEYPIHGVVIKKLDPFTTYAVQVAVLTFAGLGPYSRPVYAETCRCPSSLSTSFRNLMPFFNVEAATRVRSGIMSDVIIDAALFCCDTCTNGHGRTNINLTHDSIGNSSLKQDNSGLKLALSENSSLVFPIQNGADRINFFQYPYVPVLETPGISIYSSRVDYLTSTARMVTEVVVNLLIYVLIFTLLTVLTGLFMWVIQCNPLQFYRSNEKHYSDVMTQGGAAGIWWAANTLLRFGGGDIPVGTGKMARIYSMFVQLLGIVMYCAMISSTTVAFIIYCFTLTQTSIYSKEVGTLNDSYDSSVVLRWGGKLKAQGATAEELLKLLADKKVERLVVDSLYTSFHYKTFNNDPNAVFRGTRESHSSYGLVLSGDAIRLQRCIRQYVNERKPSISKSVAKMINSVDLVFAPDETMSKLEALGSREVTQWFLTLVVSGGLIVLLAIIGCIYECRRRKQNKIYAFVLEHDSCQLVYEKEALEMMGKFHMDSLNMLDRYELKHARERLDLLKNLRKTVKFLTPDQTLGISGQ